MHTNEILQLPSRRAVPEQPPWDKPILGGLHWGSAWALQELCGCSSLSLSACAQRQQLLAGLGWSADAAASCSAAFPSGPRASESPSRIQRALSKASASSFGRADPVPKPPVPPASPNFVLPLPRAFLKSCCPLPGPCASLHSLAGRGASALGAPLAKMVLKELLHLLRCSVVFGEVLHPHQGFTPWFSLWALPQQEPLSRGVSARAWRCLGLAVAAETLLAPRPWAAEFQLLPGAEQLRYTTEPCGRQPWQLWQAAALPAALEPGRVRTQLQPRSPPRHQSPAQAPLAFARLQIPPGMLPKPSCVAPAVWGEVPTAAPCFTPCPRGLSSARCSRHGPGQGLRSPTRPSRARQRSRLAWGGLGLCPGFPSLLCSASQCPGRSWSSSGASPRGQGYKSQRRAPLASRPSVSARSFRAVGKLLGFISCCSPSALLVLQMPSRCCPVLPWGSSGAELKGSVSRPGAGKCLCPFPVLPVPLPCLARVGWVCCLPSPMFSLPGGRS